MPRQRRPLDRQFAVRDARLIVIATEDTEATVAYFEALAQNYQNPRVQVKVLERDDTNSSPERVLELLDDYRQTYQVDEDDELWLVIDVDRWGDKKLSEVSTQSKQKGMFFAVSNPAIEVWFLLHLTDLDTFDEARQAAFLKNKNDGTTRPRLEREIINLVGRYNKSNLNIDGFLPHVETAIERAEQLDIQPPDSWPQQLGTHVYKVVKSIIASASYKP